PLFESRGVELVIEGGSSAPPPRSLRLGGEPTDERVHRRDAESGEKTQRIEIQADTRMLRQAFLNLLRNAAEAIPKDKAVRRVTIHSSIETEQGKQWAIISIQDTGDGIAPADLQKIFIPFFTTTTGGQ